VPLDTNAPSTASPLWIIALFIALSEAMAAIAAIATDGLTRLIFACFASLFPLIVLTVFIWMLLKHPGNLYSPAQYTEQTKIEDFVQVLSRANQDREVVLKGAIAEAVVTAKMGESVPTASRDQDSLREQVVESIARFVDEASITVDRASILEGAAPVQIPVTEETTVGSLLDSIYFTISAAVEPFTYNNSWVLADEDFGVLENMGTEWAEQQGWSRDTRSLNQVGIKPGSRLAVVPKSKPLNRTQTSRTVA
jgi:hypothetical protein